MVGGGSHAAGGGREGPPGAGERDRRGPSEIQTRRLSFSPSAEHDRVASGHLRPGQVLGQDRDAHVDIHGTELTAKAHEAGLKVLHQVTTPEEAGGVAAEGADVIVAQGAEGGGHVGSAMSTMALVPQAVDLVKPVPVLAAGGIADGRGMAAAIMLGAQGVLMGTRFLATVECHGRGHSKDALLNSLGSQTLATN